MIFCDSGVVLVRRLSREADRFSCVYTRGHGRLNLLFGGANRPAGKLKALSEPLAWGDYRIHMRKSADYGRGVGGNVMGVFPYIRSDFNRTCCALHMCELILRLTPEHQPSPEKYDLLLAALRALDSSGASEWLIPAFTLRLLDLAGFGLKRTAVGIDSRLWDFLHETRLENISGLSLEDTSLLRQTQDLVIKCLEEQLNQPLRTSRFISRERPSPVCV